jgi:hypothetical protein
MSLKTIIILTQITFSSVLISCGVDEGNSSSDGNSTIESSSITGGSVSALNFLGNKIRNSGFLLGSASSINSNLAKVELRYDELGDWLEATITADESCMSSCPWKIKLPSATDDDPWTLGETHKIEVRLLNSDDTVLHTETFDEVTKVGINRDINGDGHDDQVIGAAFGAVPTVYIFYGSSTGISASPGTTLTGEAGSQFGYAAASAGDLNGDGFGDIVVGANTSTSNSGAAYVYYGSVDGIDDVGSASADVSLSITGTPINSYFGYSVNSAGDLNGDGIDELVVGAMNVEVNGQADGSTYVYYGSKEGISNDPSVTLTPRNSNGSANFGASVNTAGDLNGDGYGDLVIGAPRQDGMIDGFYTKNTGIVYIYHGSSSGINSIAEMELVGVKNINLGTSVYPGGDLNGDGYEDLVVGAPANDSHDNTSTYPQPMVYIYNGSPTGPGSVPDQKIISYGTEFNNTDVGTDGTSFAGHLSTGDINGDGYNDIVISAFREDIGATVNRGSVYIHFGSSSGVSTTEDKNLINPNDVGDHFGSGVSLEKDVNGDGFNDLIIGAWFANGLRGTSYVFYGKSGNIDDDEDLEITSPDAGDLTFGTFTF